MPYEGSPAFSGGMTINQNKNIRARLFKEGYLPGKIKTESYLLLSNEQKLPIVSISANPDDFFDYYTGIYERGPNASNDFPYFGANFWQDWEKPVHIELFEPDGSTSLSANAGVKITGNYSRGNDQKSLAFLPEADMAIKFSITSFLMTNLLNNLKLFCCAIQEMILITP
jgi:hypothetical protein